MEELEKYEVTAERKSIYADFQDMTDKFGIEIIKEQIGRETFTMQVPENLNWQR